MEPTIDIKKANRSDLTDFLKSADVYAGHSRDSIDDLRSLAAKVKANGLKASTGLAGNAKLKEAKLGEVPQDDLLAKAKAEHGAAKAAKAAGEKIPDTPHLNELNRRHAAGESPKRRKAAKVEQPRPTPGKGWTVIELRNDKHGQVVTDALSPSPAQSSTVDGRYLLVRDTEAQQVFADLSAAAVGPLGQFAKRLLTLTGLAVRQAFPKVTDDRTALVARLVTELHAQVKIGDVKDWSVGWASDGTPVFTIDGTEHATTRAAAKSVGVQSKA